MYDNKIRLSPDVLEKAEVIAQEWGLKNARAAVEAVFRRYADEYLGGRHTHTITEFSVAPTSTATRGIPVQSTPVRTASKPSSCEALDELDELLGL